MIVLTACIHASAQLTVGNTGITVLTGTIFSSEGLALTPASDLNISNNSLGKSTTPVPGTPNGSIGRVYKFTSTVNFSGVTAIHYLQSELNGNTENQLQIAHSVNGSAYTITTGSTVDAAGNYVSNTVNNPSLLAVTAAQTAGALPVTLVFFTGRLENETVLLNWRTVGEQNSSHFVVQRSFDTKHFEEIGKVQAFGNSAKSVDYGYQDNPATINLWGEEVYYRLQPFDLDGSSAFSRIVNVKVTHRTDQLSLMGNPVRGEAVFRYESRQNARIMIRLTDLNGRELLAKSENVTIGTNTFLLPTASLTSGAYLIEVSGDDGRKTLKMMKE